MFDNSRRFIKYFIEEGPPATILEVNSNEYSEKTQSLSVAPGDGSSTRLSPFNANYVYRYPQPLELLPHR